MKAINEYKTPRKRLRRTAALCLSLLLLSGCGAEKTPEIKGAAENEILTHTPVDQSKEMITVHYEYGTGGELFETIVEEAFPNVDIVMVHDGSNSPPYPLRQNLINGVERDIILTNSAQAINDIAPDYLLDLSSQGCVSNYYITALESCIDKDGKLYYLPGPSDVYGVVYNRTMFEENGWEVPHSYSEFVNLIKTINNAGLTAVETQDGKEVEVPVKAVQPSIKFADAFQIVFNTFAYETVYRGAENMQWLIDYQHGESSMAGHMEPAAKILIRLFDDGILSREDWNVRPYTRSEKMYLWHSTAMIYENQNAYKSNVNISGDNEPDEVGMFPFWTSDEPKSDYLYSIPSCYIAINKASAEESPQKKQILLDILDFISQPATQERLVDNKPQISSVQGVPIKFGDFGKEIEETIKEGRIVNNFFFVGGTETKTVENKLRETAPDLAEGKISIAEWLSGADAARDSYFEEDTVTVYGRCEKTLTRLETAIAVGEMYRFETGAPIALVYAGRNSYSVNGFMYEGDITDKSLECISAARRGDTEEGLAVAYLTGAQIMEIISGDPNNTSWGDEGYYAVVGLNVEYAPWQPPGDRLISISLPDGGELKPEESYEVAYFKGTLFEISETEKVMEPEGEVVLGGTWKEHFIHYLSENNGVLKAPKQTMKLVWDTENE